MAPLQTVGGHFRGAQNAASTAWIANCQTVKALDDASYFDKGNVGQFQIFRIFMGTGNSQYQLNSPQAFFDKLVSKLGGRRPTYIEGPNECGLDDLPNYVAWIAHAAGYRVAGFSFPTGNPTSSQWAYCRSQGWAGVDAIAMHEYWAKSGFTIYNALRHRTLWQTGDPPIIISETGRDCVDTLANQCPSNCGLHCGWNGDLQGPISAQQYANELIAYDQALNGDFYVLAANVFTHGGAPDFASFEIDPIAAIYWNTTPACGADGQPCCTGNTCADGYTCNNGTCKPNQIIDCGGGCPTGLHCNAANVCVCFTDADCVTQYGPGNCCDQQFQCAACNTVPPGQAIDLGTVAAFAAVGIVGVGLIAAVQAGLI